VDDPSNKGLSAAERIMAGLAKLSLVMRHEAWRASGERGLTPTQSQILATLDAAREPLGIKLLSQQMALTMGTTSEAVSSLVEKGLVRKDASPADGRAIVLTLSAKGRREAAAAAQWPDSMLSAIEVLPDEERAALLRGLIGMVRALQEQGAVSTTRMCLCCRFFEPNAYAGEPKPHHCKFLDAPIADIDLRLDCDEMEAAAVEDRPRLWEVFINGQRRSDGQPGQGSSPTNLGPTNTSPEREA
jgi:DNA-binding MarR family transcriptional regulator